METEDLLAALDTIAAYLDVLRRQRTVALAQDNVEGHRQIRDMIRLRVGAKVSRRSDLDQSDSRLALALANLRQEKGALTNAEATYRRLVGRAPEALEFSEAPMRQLPGVWGAVPAARVAVTAAPVAEPASEAVAATADGEPALPVPRPAEADAADALFTALSSELADVEGHYGKAMLDTQQDAVKAALDRHPAVQAARQALATITARIPLGQRMTEAAEIALMDGLEQLAPQAEKHFTAGEYREALQLLANIKPAVDRFFTEVMVMVDDPAVRNNRAALLQQLGTLMNRVADISRLAA